VPGIQASFSRQPAPLARGEQALPHRSRPTNTGSGSEPRRPAQKRKTPEPSRRAPSGEGTQRHRTSPTTETNPDFCRGAPHFQAATGGADPSISDISKAASSGLTCGHHTSNYASKGGHSSGTSRDVPPGRASAINIPSMGVPPVGISTVGDASPMGASSVGRTPPVGVAAGGDPVVGGATSGSSVPVSTIRANT
jgi:hypothetical protein